MTQFDKNIETTRNELFKVLLSTQYYCCHYKFNQLNYGSCNKRLCLLLTKSPFKFVLHYEILPICVLSCHMKLSYTIPSKFKIIIKKLIKVTRFISEYQPVRLQLHFELHRYYIGLKCGNDFKVRME